MKGMVYCPHCRRLSKVRREDVRLICMECGREVTYDGPPVKEKEAKSIRQEEEKLKLYVWDGDDVLRDYTPGMICVLAHSLEEAIKLVREKDEVAMGEFPVDKFKVIEKPEAFICWGGG